MLPLPSLKVQVTIWSPCVLRLVASVVVPVIEPEQLSVAVGALLMEAEHCPVASAKETASATGVVVSCTLIHWVCVEMLPLPSLKVQVTIWSPCVLRLVASVVVPVIESELLSVAVGALLMDAEH